MGGRQLAGLVDAHHLEAHRARRAAQHADQRLAETLRRFRNHGISSEARDRAAQIVDTAGKRSNEIVEESRGTASSEAQRIVAQAQDDHTISKVELWVDGVYRHAVPLVSRSHGLMMTISLGLAPIVVKAIYDAYVMAKKRCGEDTRAVTLDSVASSLRKQVPELMKQHNAKSVEFKVVIKDGKAVLRALPKD